ncbi:hypothetical protein SAMN05421853_10830 [Roseivivax halotolerans]|uniref:Uncharacterized protein n=1 Tax=Roseivivax halotolerans TaxID=93684 RepID=A0A1I5Z6A9_9RHOB|nr:hypothetical protein [Roseivivax halotolerans]SFQ52003.1 hypothetical protein SAMN05421853_10830 [Roseivivax halotolerans]
MESAFQPDPLLMALIFAKRFIYLEVLFGLALLRLVLAKGRSRLVAGLVAALCALFILVTFAPALGLQTNEYYPPLARLLAAGQGLRVPLALSALFFVSAILPSRARRWIDVAHIALLAGFLGLWAATLG